MIDLGSRTSLNWEVVTMDAAKDDIPAAMALLTRRRRSVRRPVLEETPEGSLPFVTDDLLPPAREERLSPYVEERLDEC